jgi:hypothetical protein
MRWIVHSEKPLYADPRLDIRVADVELPDGRHLEHRLIHTAPGAGAVVTDHNGRVLLLRRHQFITDTWAWEIPIGKADPSEDPALAAREVEEERAGGPGRYAPCSASSRPRGSPTRCTTCTAPMAPHISGHRRMTLSPAASSRCRWIPSPS